MTDERATGTLVEPQDRLTGRFASAARSTAAATFALCLIWGLAFPILKIGLGFVGPETLAVARALIASVVLLPAALLGRRPSGAERRSIHRVAMILGLLNVTGLYGLQSWGIYYIPSGLGAMLLYAQPLLMALGARLWFQEPLGRKRAAGLVLGWLGIAVVLGGGRPDALGAFLTLAGAALWAAGSLVFKLVPRDVPLMKLLFWQNLYGMIPLLVVALLGGRPVPWEPEVLAVLLYMGGIASVGGFALLFLLLRRGEAAVVAARIFAVPIVGAALGVVLLGEPLTIGLVIGGLGVAAGIRLVNETERPGARASPAALPGDSLDG